MWVLGATYRFRFIRITANGGQQLKLQGPVELEWRALARDGADYRRELALKYPTLDDGGPGMTYDFEFAPPEPGDYELRVTPILPAPANEATVLPIRVRAR